MLKTDDLVSSAAVVNEVDCISAVKSGKRANDAETEREHV